MTLQRSWSWILKTYPSFSFSAAHFFCLLSLPSVQKHSEVKEDGNHSNKMGVIIVWTMATRLQDTISWELFPASWDFLQQSDLRCSYSMQAQHWHLLGSPCSYYCCYYLNTISKRSLEHSKGSDGPVIAHICCSFKQVSQKLYNFKWETVLGFISDKDKIHRVDSLVSIVFQASRISRKYLINSALMQV